MVMYQCFFYIGGGFESHRLRQIKTPCSARGFLFFLYSSTLFNACFYPVLYAYAYFCMPYYTHYAKRQCKTKMQNESPALY